MAITREQELTKWLNRCFNLFAIKLQPLGGDAGFRGYYRFFINEQSYIAVDAAPKTSNNLGFIVVAKSLEKLGVVVPKIHYYDQSNGFFCLADLGDTLLADKLNQQTAKKLYTRAMQEIYKFSHSSECAVDHERADTAEYELANYKLPKYDHTLLNVELAIFTDWLLDKHLGLELSPSDTLQLEQCFERLVDNALEQPQVFVHRDFHCRNIMITDKGALAVIDFQDAVKGPICYDIVSLLKDCYVRWPQELVDDLFNDFCQKMAEQEHLKGISTKQWLCWFDLMGLQRHIKASGIFARLHHRDNKSNYLKDIPLTLGYIADVASQYPELTFLNQLVTNKVIPRLTELSSDEAN